MRRERSLKNDITLWFAGIFLVLYTAAAAALVAIDDANGVRQLGYLIYAEVEAVESCVAASGTFDCHELKKLEQHQPPVWLRVTRGRSVLAATPGSPPLPVHPRLTPPAEPALYRTAANGPLALIHHDVEGRPDLAVEGISHLSGVHQRSRSLALWLSLTGLFLVPLIALGGRILAGRALRPVEELVAAIRHLDTARLAERLPVPGSVREIGGLAREFNLLLDRLELSVARMQRFTADASHELRTPVAILRTGLEVALRRNRTAEEYRTLLRENLLEIDRVQRVVEGLLALAREAAGEEAPPRTPVDLSAVVHAAADSIAPAAGEKGVAVERQVGGGIRVAGDADRLGTMALNLLDNAVRHTPEGRRVRIRLDAVDGAARLVVADEGRGIPPEERSRLFQRFYRGRPAGGSGGLGLSVVRWVAESHGGGVRLLEDEGPGAAFEVVLPLLER